MAERRVGTLLAIGGDPSRQRRARMVGGGAPSGGADVCGAIGSDQVVGERSYAGGDARVLSNAGSVRVRRRSFVAPNASEGIVAGGNLKLRTLFEIELNPVPRFDAWRGETVGDRHRTTGEAEAEVEQGAAAHVLEHDGVVHGAQGMHRELNEVMRSYRFMPGSREVRDSEPGRKTADSNHVGLKDVDRIGGQIS